MVAFKWLSRKKIRCPTIIFPFFRKGFNCFENFGCLLKHIHVENGALFEATVFLVCFLYAVPGTKGVFYVHFCEDSVRQGCTSATRR